MPAVGVLLLLISSFFPEADDPFPDRIGPDAPFTWAGAGGVVASVLFAGASSSKQERAISWGGVIGFVFGGGLYLLSLSFG